MRKHRLPGATPTREEPAGDTLGAFRTVARSSPPSPALADCAGRGRADRTTPLGQGTWGSREAWGVVLRLGPVGALATREARPARLEGSDSAVLGGHLCPWQPACRPWPRRLRPAAGPLLVF